MNVLMLMKPKSEIEYLIDTYTLRQGLEKMRAHGYMAIPVISKEGLYVGSVSEGDFLWHIIDSGNEKGSIKKCESYKIGDILDPGRYPAVTVDVEMKTLIERAEKQNYVPVTDDRGYFIGIVTRSTIIRTFCEKNIECDMPAVIGPKSTVLTS